MTDNNSPVPQVAGSDGAGAVTQGKGSAHTPGPWKLYSEQGVTGPTASPAVYWPRDIKWCEVTVGSEVVAYIARSDALTDVQHANARLIAASPDMLEVLQAVSEASAESDSALTFSIAMDKIIDQVRAVIAKALGQEAQPSITQGATTVSPASEVARTDGRGLIAEMLAELTDILRSIEGGGDVVTFGEADTARYRDLIARATGERA